MSSAGLPGQSGVWGHLPDGKGLGPLSPTCPANPDGNGLGSIPQPVRRRPTRPVNRCARPSRSAMLARRTAPDFGGRFTGSQHRRGVGAEREGSQARASRKNGARSRARRPSKAGRARGGMYGGLPVPPPSPFADRRNRGPYVAPRLRTKYRPTARHTSGAFARPPRIRERQWFPRDFRPTTPDVPAPFARPPRMRGPLLPARRRIPTLTREGCESVKVSEPLMLHRPRAPRPSQTQVWTRFLETVRLARRGCRTNPRPAPDRRRRSTWSRDHPPPAPRSDRRRNGARAVL
jgi:hypothetical protein